MCRVEQLKSRGLSLCHFVYRGYTKPIKTKLAAAASSLRVSLPTRPGSKRTAIPAHAKVCSAWLAGPSRTGRVPPASTAAPAGKCHEGCALGNENEGIDETQSKAFILYLLSYHRPVTEVLAPQRLDVSAEYKRGFEGMVDQSVSLDPSEGARRSHQGDRRQDAGAA